MNGEAPPRARFTFGGLVGIQFDTQLLQHEAYLERELARSGGAEPACLRIDIRDEAVEDLHRPAITFADTGGLTSRGSFVCNDRRNHYCAVDLHRLGVRPDLQIDLGICCAAFSPAMLLDQLIVPIALFVAAANDWAPLHASAIRDHRRREALLFSGWTQAGKTNLLLARLADGHGYVADDQALVSSRGTTLPTGRTIAAHSLNSPFIGKRIGAPRRLAMSVGRSIMRLLLRRGPRSGGRRTERLAAYLVRVLTNVHIPIARTRSDRDLHEIPVAAHLRCMTGKGSSGPVETVPDVAAEVHRHLALMEHEYREFRKFLHGWRWATGTGPDPWTALSARWEEILRGYFASVPILLTAEIPHGAGPGVVDTLWSEIERTMQGEAR